MNLNKQWAALNRLLSGAHLKQQDGTAEFIKSFLKNPKSTGAIYPSSKRLAKIMASYVIFSQNQLVVELGAGTGIITQAMLHRGIPATRIIAIESSSFLAEKLRQRFPKINVIDGDASHLVAFLKNEKRPIGTILSGLPLRSLEKEMTDHILSNIPLVLSPQGRYIQFTYDLRNNTNFYPPQYQLLRTKRVWANIPPAKVEVYGIVPKTISD